MRETGVGIYDPLFFIGVVENNIDERLEGRVQVRAFGVHGTVDQVPTASLPWATLIHGSYDPNAPVPPVNSFVFGFFIDGRDAQQPMLLGVIPTQLLDPIDPELNGWGAIPGKNADVLSRGYRPNDIGQPVISREARGEDIANTYVLQQEMNRRSSIPIASMQPDGDSRDIWSEPHTPYNAKYPFNRVIRSGKNIIELDDTPGSERVSIYHETSGSYVSIDSSGTTTHKTMGERYEVNERNNHIYIKGYNTVTIDGDSHVFVKGNKIEEIGGDLIQNVRGNLLLSVGGQMNLNAGEDLQARGAKIRIEANVEGVNVKAGKNVKIESGEFLHVKSGTTAILEAADAINVNAKGDNVNIQASADLNIKSNRTYVTSEGALDLYGDHVKIGGGSKVSINASLVAIDDIIQLAETSSVAPETAGDAAEADPAEATEMPEPVSRGVTISTKGSMGRLGSVGFASRDEGNPETLNTDTSLNFAANASMGLIDLIKSFEGFSEYPYEDYGQWSIGYGTGVGPSSLPPKIPGPISEQDAVKLLEKELQKYIVNVETINTRGNYDWSQESKDALVSFAYNIGSIDQLTDGGTRDNQTIANRMLEYVNAGGVPNSGLKRRRAIEREKFINGLSGQTTQVIS